MIVCACRMDWLIEFKLLNTVLLHCCNGLILVFGLYLVNFVLKSCLYASVEFLDGLNSFYAWEVDFP